MHIESKKKALVRKAESSVFLFKYCGITKETTIVAKYAVENLKKKRQRGML